MTSGTKRYNIVFYKDEDGEVVQLWHGPYFNLKDATKEKERLLKYYIDELKTNEWPRIMTIRVENEYW